MDGTIYFSALISLVHALVNFLLTCFQVQVEVNQIGGREFLIKLYCEQKRSGFARLMEAIHSFGLQVIDANVSTVGGKVLNILTVEVKEI